MVSMLNFRGRGIILLSYIGIQPSHYEDPLSTKQHHEITNHCSNNGFSKSWPDNEKKGLFLKPYMEVFMLFYYTTQLSGLSIGHYKNRPTTMMRRDLDTFFSWPKCFKCRGSNCGPTTPCAWNVAMAWSVSCRLTLIEDGESLGPRCAKWDWNTLYETNIFHPGKRKIIFKSAGWEGIC